MPQFRRKVFYVGGYDPRGVRHYYQLVKESLRKFSTLTNEDVHISPRSTVSNARTDWTITNVSKNVTTEYSFLRWEDIVRKSWIRSPFRLALRSLIAYWKYFRHLDFRLARKLGRGPLVTLLYPPVLSILVPLLVALPISLIALLWLPALFAVPFGLIAGVAIARPFLIAIRVAWLMRFFVFNSELGKGEDNPDISARLDIFADQIVSALDEDYDELLLVAHSNGCILSMQIMARIFETSPHPNMDKFALVTLGHCIPLVACRRDATVFHEQLRTVSANTFSWVDIGSPPDGAAYYGVNPLLIKGKECRPLVELLSPRFHKFFEANKGRQGLRGKYEIHFDYLRCGDRPSPIDFPHLMTANVPITESIKKFKSIG